MFEVLSSSAEAFLATWRERAEIMSAAPGFLDTRLHRAVSSKARFRFVNVAHWSSKEQLEAAQRSLAFQKSLSNTLAYTGVRFAANLAVYEVAVEFFAD